MTLEDHAGDVVRKSRLMFDIAAAEAAQAAGITLAALEAFEQSGQVPTGIQWAGLAARLDLDPGKLSALAAGWTPKPVEVSAWREFRMLTSEGDGMTVNCYLIWDEVTREAALFDTGFAAEPIVELLQKEGLTLQHLFITHSHGDHVAALEPLRNQFPKAKLHTSSPAAPPQHRNRSTDFIHLGSLRISNRETPGHADDGVTYLVGNFPDDAPGVAIVGDAIFAGSVGGAPKKGSPTKQKIREQILSLPPETLLCPGHGPLTTVGEQALANPFFR